jgi:hypothetical protein
LLAIRAKAYGFKAALMVALGRILIHLTEQGLRRVNGCPKTTPTGEMRQTFAGLSFQGMQDHAVPICGQGEACKAKLASAKPTSTS